MLDSRRNTIMLTTVSATASSSGLQPAQRPPRQPHRRRPHADQRRDQQVAHGVADPPDRPERRVALGAAAGSRARRGRQPEGGADQRARRAPRPPTSSSTSRSRASRASKRTASSRLAPTTASSVFPTAMIAAPQSGMPVVEVDGERAGATAGQRCGPRRTSAASAIPVGGQTVVAMPRQGVEREPEARGGDVGDEDDGVIQAAPDCRRHPRTILRAADALRVLRAFGVLGVDDVVLAAPRAVAARSAGACGRRSAPPPAAPAALRYSASAILCDAFCSRSNAPSNSCRVLRRRGCSRASPWRPSAPPRARVRSPSAILSRFSSRCFCTW